MHHLKIGRHDVDIFSVLFDRSSPMTFSPKNVVSLLLKEFVQSADGCEASRVEKKIFEWISLIFSDLTYLDTNLKSIMV